jgi:hypothetical protein
MDRFASILRITSPRLLDFPAVHSVAKEAFVAKFPQELVLDYQPSDTLQALALANEYKLLKVSVIRSYHVTSSYACLSPAFEGPESLAV